jgi:hypothetical protein
VVGHLVYININLFPMFHYIVLNIIYIRVCAIFVDIIICVLFVGRWQSISCDNFLSNPIAVLFKYVDLSQS